MTPVRTLLAARPTRAVAVVGAFLVLAACGSGGSANRPAATASPGASAAGLVLDEHGFPVVGSRADFDRLVNAAQAAAESQSQAALAAEGQRIFRDASIAKDGESCQTCHAEGAASGGVGTIFHFGGSGDFVGPRDPIPLWGIAQTAPYFWDGRKKTLTEAVAAPVQNHLKATVSSADKAKAVAAIEAYLRTLKPPTSPFDTGTMSKSAQRGETIFRGKGGCVECHSGPLFTDNSLHDVRVPQVPVVVNGKTLAGTDPGSKDQPGSFNTPELRDVRNTAPYMHNGAFKTLREVVDFYNTRSIIAPLNLSATDINDLVAYLEAL